MSLSLSLASSPAFSATSVSWSSHKRIKPVPLPAFHKRSLTKLSGRSSSSVRAFFLNPTEDPLVKEALKEPVAFLGGMFAGLLRLDLNEDPLREWVNRTVEASGLATEVSTETDNPSAPDDEGAPLQIEIE